MDKRNSPSKVHFKRFALNSLNQYRLMKKLNLKYVNKIEMPIYENEKQKEPFLSEFNKFLLKHKAYNALDFTNTKGLSAFETMKIRKQILIVKKQSRIKKLIIPLGASSSRILDIRRTVHWIRHTKNLKMLDCAAPYNCENPNVEDLRNDVIFWKAIKRNRLEVLRIDSRNLLRKMSRFTLKLNNSPSTVKELCLKNTTKEVASIGKDPKISLSSLKNLKSLSLSLCPDLKLWETLLTSIPNPNQLVKLHLNVLDKLEEDFTLSYFTLQENNQVRFLELSFEDVPKDIDNFTKSFQNGKLKILKISANEIELTPRKKWYWIVNLLKSNLELEKIKISVSSPFDDGLKDEDKFYKSLIKAISKLKQLKKLKLSLNDSVLTMLSIKKLYNLENIEEISFEVNCIMPLMWDDLINLSQHFGSNLKKLKLDLGEINLGEIIPGVNDLKQLQDLIRSLKVIEVLDLRQFEIPSSKFWKEFTNDLTELKNLRKLKLRTIDMEEKELDQGILSLISMPSLKSLECYKYPNKYCTYSGFSNHRKFNIENQLERKQLIYDLQGKSVDINSSENKTKRHFKRGLFLNFAFDS